MERQIPLFKVFMPESVMEPLRKTLMSGFIGQGPKVEEFEKGLIERIGNPRALSLNSATSALHLALRLAGIQRNDEVISTPLTCTATNWPILANGGKIVWADVDPATANIDPKSIVSLITSKTKAIMVVHWGGYPCDMDEILNIAKRHGLAVVEDCAHAFGAEYKGKPLGNQGTFACFSFQAIKHMTTVDGGMLVCPNDKTYHRGKLLRWYGIDRSSPKVAFRCEDDIPEWGYKFHMNDVNATIGIEQLKYIGETLAKHRANAAYFRQKLAGVPGVTLMDEKPDRKSSYWIFTIKVDRRDDFMRRMQEKGIAVSRVHERNDKHSCVAAFKRPLPQLEELLNSIICIPVGWWLSEEDRSYIVDTIRQGW
jgi:dTDP-4-amino-4,6-dideoxygalactose transaminase